MKKEISITLLVLIIGSLILYALFTNKPETQPKVIPEPRAQSVEVISVSPATWRLNVPSFGTAMPKRQFDLISEVSGRVIDVHTNFTDGGRFAAGEVLLSIDSTDYQLALVQAQSNESEAKQQLAMIIGEARQAKRVWRDLGDEEANQLFLKQPQLSSAESRLRLAQAQVAKAKADLNKTKISLPYPVRVVNKQAALGQFIGVGTTLATIYSDDVMQVRLPLSSRQLELLQIDPAQPVSLAVGFNSSSNQQQWQGNINQFESSYNQQTRLMYAIAEINQNQQHTPLVAGQYLSAQIQGVDFDHLYRIPRTALRPRNQVWIIDIENRLRFILPDIVHIDDDYAYFRWNDAKQLDVITTAITLASNGIKLIRRDVINIDE